MYLFGAMVPVGTFTTETGTYTLPSFSEHRFLLLLLPVHDVCLILPEEQVVSGLDDVRCRHKGLLTSATCHVLLRTNPSRVLTTTHTQWPAAVILNVLSSWSFDSLPILGPLSFLCGHVGKYDLRHYVLRCSRINHDCDFLRFVGRNGSVFQTPALLRRLMQGSGTLALDPLAFLTGRFCSVWANAVPQVHFPMMNFGHLPYLCCWSTRVHSLSPSGGQHHSSS